jgi:hypothetical protein
LISLRGTPPPSNKETVPQLLLALKISLIFGFKALFAFLFLPIADCWTVSKRIGLYGFFQNDRFGEFFQYKGKRWRVCNIHSRGNIGNWKDGDTVFVKN